MEKSTHEDGSSPPTPHASDPPAAQVDRGRQDADFNVEADDSTTSAQGFKGHGDGAAGTGTLTLAQLASMPTNDPNAVKWENDSDPANPMNWSAKKKWSNIGVISIMTLLTYVTALRCVACGILFAD